MFETLSEKAGFLSNEAILLLNQRFIFIENWKWIALITAITFGGGSRPLLERFIAKIKNASLKKSKQDRFWTYFLRLKIEPSASWLLLMLLGLMSIDFILEESVLGKYLILLCKIIFSYHSIVLCYLGVDAFGSVLEQMAARTENRIDDQLAPFAKKALKVIVVVVGGLVILQNIGVNVTSLLAGLGIGGLALALAAQDTAANLFGSITIIFDSPFKIGDWIKLGDIEGNVEEVGFRSTRIRTFYNSLITVPNSVVAKEKIDNMGVRPLRRIRQNLGIIYETPPDRIEAFCENIRYLLLQIEKVSKESIVVSFNGYQESSLNILLNFHINSTDNKEELQIQQKLFCDILLLAKEMDVQFAFPTRTIYYHKTDSPTGVH